MFCGYDGEFNKILGKSHLNFQEENEVPEKLTQFELDTK